MNIEYIVECIVVVLSVIGLVYFGIFIGKEFGTFEKFVLWYLNHLQGKDRVLPPYESDDKK